MPVGCVVGLQWGDEGKGKIVDLLAREADVIVRFQGGANAGHTVKVGEDTFILHLIPSGILHAGKICVISNGVVLDPEVLLGEVARLEERGIEIGERLKVSDRTHLVLPHHLAIDRHRESRAAMPIGTTVRGIGPAYADKAHRVGIRAGETRHLDRFAGRVRAVTESANVVLTRVLEAEALDVEATVESCVDAARRLAPYVSDTTTYLHDALDAGRELFLEGAQGTRVSRTPQGHGGHRPDSQPLLLAPGCVPLDPLESSDVLGLLRVLALVQGRQGGSHGEHLVLALAIDPDHDIEGASGGAAIGREEVARGAVDIEGGGVLL